jgi:hypothetical protein
VYSRTELIDRSQIARSRRFIAAEPTGAGPGPSTPLADGIEDLAECERLAARPPGGEVCQA